MHEQRVGRGGGHQLLVDLVVGEIFLTLGLFFFLAHAGPDVGVDGRSAGDRFLGVVGEGQLHIGTLGAKGIEECRLELIALGRRNCKMDA